MPGAGLTCALRRGAALAALLSALAASGALAQQPAIGVAVVSEAELFSGSAFGRALASRDEASRRALQSENQRLDAALEAEERDLTTRRSAMTPEAFRALATAFDIKVKGIRAAQDSKARDLSRSQDEARLTFLQAARPVLQDLMRETGASVLLDRDAVLMLRDNADLTAAAIARIDSVLGDGSAVPPAPPPQP